MSTEQEKPQEYKLSFSDRTRERIIELGAIARERGDGDQYIAALKEFIRRLRIYPQFGDPLYDIKPNLGHIRLGVVAPLVMRYGVCEDDRLVLAVALPTLLSLPRNSGNG